VSLSLGYTLVPPFVTPAPELLDAHSYGISDTSLGSFAARLGDLDPEPNGGAARTTTLLEGWMQHIPGDVAHASTLGMGSSCSTAQAQEGPASH
jgi:hypothetical protein